MGPNHPLEEFHSDVNRFEVYPGWEVALSDGKGSYITIDFPDDPKSYRIDTNYPTGK